MAAIRTIKINVSSVIGLSGQIDKAKSTVTGVRQSVGTVKNQIDSRILGRSNIKNRLSNVATRLSTVENRIAGIKRTVENGANRYNDTDVRVRSLKHDLEGRISTHGSSGSLGAGIGKTGAGIGGAVAGVISVLGGGGSASAVTNTPTVSFGRSGSFLGIDTSFNAELDAFGYSVKDKTQSKFSKDKGEFYTGVGKEFEGHVLKGTVSGSIGALHVKSEHTLGEVKASGKIGATLFKDGKLAPSLNAKLKGEAVAYDVQKEVKLGSDENNAHLKGSGKIFAAEAEAGVGIGVIERKDENGNVVREAGVEAKVGAEAYVAEGKASGGFTLFGIKVDASISAKAGGAGVTAGGSATTGGVRGKIGAGLGLGAGLEVSIDWSDFKWDLW